VSKPTTVAGKLLLADWDVIPVENRVAIIEAVEAETRQRIMTAVERLPIVEVSDAAWTTRGVLHIDTTEPRQAVDRAAVLAIVRGEL